MSDFNMEAIPTKLIMVTIQVIILAAFAIPTILSFAHGPGIHPGDTTDYYASANIPDAEFDFSGTAMTYAKDYHEGDTHIHIEWPKDVKGKFTLIVTATTIQPEQTVVKTIEYDVEGDWQYTALLLAIPTLMIVSIIVFLIKPIRESFRRRGGGEGGGDISSGLNRSAPHDIYPKICKDI